MRRLRLLTAGESHGPGLVAVLEGMPHGLELDRDRLDALLRRRQRGYGRSDRQRIERDEVEILGGVRHGRTLGGPVALLLRNRDHERWSEEMAVDPPPAGWSSSKQVRTPRPGHADLAGALKLDLEDARDVLERASARETAARVAAGGVCMQLLETLGVRMRSHVCAMGEVALDPDREVAWEEIAALAEDDDLPCVDEEVRSRMRAAVDEAREDADTLGGVFEVVVAGLPVGLGSHVHWDRKLDGRLAGAVVSIQGIKAVEIGDAVRCAGLPGSRAHDELVRAGAGIERRTNRAGGLEGGITNGREVRVRGWMKPLATLMKPLESVDLSTGEASAALVERSDVCSVPAAGVVGEAMVALVLADAILESFGGDSMAELAPAVERRRERVESLFPTGGAE